MHNIALNKIAIFDAEAFNGRIYLASPQALEDYLEQIVCEAVFGNSIKFQDPTFDRSRSGQWVAPSSLACANCLEMKVLAACEKQWRRILRSYITILDKLIEQLRVWYDKNVGCNNEVIPLFLNESHWKYAFATRTTHSSCKECDWDDLNQMNVVSCSVVELDAKLLS